MSTGAAMKLARSQERKSAVIIVDDDEAVRDGLRFLIRSLDMPIRTYASAEEMLDDKLAGHGGCIILDVDLPGMDGFELCSRLAELAIDMPVVFITGGLKRRSRARASELGAFAYLEKPIDANLMLRTVQRAVQQSADGASAESRPI